MSIELKVPGFPESVADGTVLSWNKKPGDPVKRDESLVDIETDKVVFEVPAPQDGVLEEIIEEAGAVVVSGQLIGRMKNSTGQVAANSETEQAAAVPEPAAEAPFATPSKTFARSASSGSESTTACRRTGWTTSSVAASTRSSSAGAWASADAGRRMRTAAAAKRDVPRPRIRAWLTARARPR